MENLIDSVDFSYLDYPDGSNGRVLGRRKEAHKLAKKYCEMKGINYDESNHIKLGGLYQNAYFQICIWEADKVAK